MLDPASRALRARIAATDRATQPGYDGAAATAPATAGYWAKYEDRVDPGHVLDPAERRRRAKAKWQTDMQRGKLKKRARA